MPSHDWVKWSDAQGQERNVLSAERLPYIFRRPMSLPCRPEYLARLHQAVDAGADESVLLHTLCGDPGIFCRFIRNFAIFNSRLGTKSLELEQALALAQRHHWLAFISTLGLATEVERPLPARLDWVRMSEFCQYLGYACFEFASEVLVGYSPYHASALGALHELPSLVLANASPDTFDYVADHAASNAISFHQAFSTLYQTSLEGYGAWIARAWRFDEDSVASWHVSAEMDDTCMVGSLVRVVSWASYTQGLRWEPWHAVAELSQPDKSFYDKYKDTIDPIMATYLESHRPAA